MSDHAQTSPEDFWSRVRQGTVLIVGLSKRTGLPAAKLLAAHGVRCKISDSASQEELASLVAELPDAVEAVFTGPQGPEQLEGISEVLVAPGVPRNIPLLQEAKRRAIPVRVDIDFLFPIMAQKRIVAITGTDGKTTTTTLTGELLQPLGEVLVAGNIGRSVLDCYDELLTCDWLVLEVSSFMLEEVSRFRPNIAAILNIAQDHIDRHASSADYAAVKLDIVRYCDEDDVLVVNNDDAVLAQAAPAHVAVRGISKTNIADSYFDGRAFHVREGCSFQYADCRLWGQANIDNILVAATIAREAGVAPERLCETARNFAGLRHRLQHVGCFHGVDVYEDSKASNVHAVEAALLNFDEGVVLIIGGRDKGLDFSPLRAHVRRLRTLVCYGEDGEKLRDAVGFDKTLYTYRFDDAVKLAVAQCQDGDVLLLSPGCTSWDQFESYEVRGDRFQQLIQRFFA